MNDNWSFNLLSGPEKFGDKILNFFWFIISFPLNS